MKVKTKKIYVSNPAIIIIFTLMCCSSIFADGTIDAKKDVCHKIESLKKNPKDKKETKKKGWIRFQIPRLRFGYGWARIKNVPDSIRTVHEYNRENNIHQLPKHTGGALQFYSIGVGVILLDRIELTYDLTSRDSYMQGTTTWDQIGFPSDDYLGYRLHGKDSNISLAYRFIRKPHLIAYSKFGLNFNDYSLSSGSDAWNKFNPQHSVDLNYRSYAAGLGCKFSAIYYELGLEFDYAFKSSVYDNISVQGFFISLQVNILIKARKPVDWQ